MSPGTGEVLLSKKQGAPGSGAAAAPAAPCFPSSLTGEKAAPPLAGQFRGSIQGVSPISPAHLPFGLHFTYMFIIICKAVYTLQTKNTCIWTKIPKKRTPHLLHKKITPQIISLTA